MDYIPCSVSGCSYEFRDIASYNAHFKVAHQACTRYVCTFEKCTRIYQRYHSFRRHLILNHHVPIFAPEPVLKTLCQNSDESCESHNFVSSHLKEAASLSGDLSHDDQSSSNVSRTCKDLLVKQEDLLVAKLYSNPGLPRNLVDTMISDFSEYLTSPFFETLEKVVLSSLDSNLPLNTQKEINDMFHALKNPFRHLQSEHQRLKYFESHCGAYIPPESYVIDYREERVKTSDGITLRMKPVLGQFVPLGKVFVKFFELPHVLEDTLSYMESLKKESHWLCNLTQCEVWQRKVSNFKDTDIVIPLNYYYDEVEPNSALGPHCEPLGCSYVQVATLPPEWRSRLENIFLALLFDSDNRSVYGNRKAFRPLLDELLKLETEGITVTVPVLGTVKLFLVVAFILGDNKGLNGVCGFQEGFNARHYCRMCVCSKDEAKKMFVEDTSKLRTPENYVEDVQRNDPLNTGIKEQCVFDCLPSFVTPTDISVDVFHDLIEGVANYTMIPVLQHFYTLNRSFIPTLNNRLYFMDLGIDGDNRPGLINLDRLLHKDKLKMTGSEMVTFIRVFGVLVFDMVPEDDEFYQLYLYLRDINSILQAKRLPRDAGKMLSLKVKEHNQLYVALTKETLKPKHHNLIHYARILNLMGPPSLLSTVRFEAKHRHLKMTSNVCMSRINLSKTVAIKQQLSFCYRCISNTSIREGVIHGPCHLVTLRDLDTFPSFSLTLPDVIFNEPDQNVVTWVTCKGTTYKPKQVVFYDVDDIGLCRFAEIELIIITTTEPVFICSYLETVGYFSDVRGHEVKRLEGVNNWFAINQCKLVEHRPLCLYHMASGQTVVLNYD